MISLKHIALVVLTAVSVVAAGPPIRRILTPLDVTLPSVGPHPAPATPGACRGADKLELQAARQELAAVKEELRRPLTGTPSAGRATVLLNCFAGVLLS
jgi:hypothetical protein